MKPIVLENWYSLVASLWEATNSSNVNYCISYSISWTSFEEKIAVWWLSNTSDTTLLDNQTTDKYVIANISFYNEDDIQHTIYLKINDWTNTYTIEKYWISNWDSTWWDWAWNWVDEKVKADSWDPIAWYLSDKVDWNTIEVDSNNHNIKVAQAYDAILVHKNWDETIWWNKIFSNNLEISNPWWWLVLTDSNGNRYLLKVDDNGDLELNSL